MNVDRTLTADSWCDLLDAAARECGRQLLQALAESSSYRDCFLATLGLLHAERRAHAATQRRYQALLTEYRAVRQRRQDAA